MRERWRALLLLATAMLVAGCGSAAAPEAAAIPRGVFPALSTAPGAPAAGSAFTALLDQSWEGYVSAFIQGDGRVIDPERNAVSTSEGESYALLRSVWTGDRTTFERVWQWIQDNLTVRSTGLFGYLWGGNGHGSWRLLSQNSAADADEDIAFALLLAARRWSDAAYAVSSRTVLEAIWAHDVATVAGQPYLSAGSWGPGSQAHGLIVDPSYMAPYEYRLFALLDPDHPWGELVTTAYAVIDGCTASPLSSHGSDGLPPDWCAIDAQGHAEAAPSMSDADTYGYDAFRTMWRVAIDVLWNGSAQGRAYLAKVPLVADWTENQTLAAEYGHRGNVVESTPDPTVEGGDLGALLIDDPAAAQSLLQTLIASYSTDGTPHFGDPRNYYEQNWVWFGIALASGAVQSFG